MKLERLTQMIAVSVARKAVLLTTIQSFSESTGFDAIVSYPVDSNFTILIAEDDPNDAILLQRAIRKVGIQNPLQIVHDGEQAIAYLAGEEPYQDRSKYPFPSFLWLDIKMPKKNGFDVLGWLQAHPKCSIIPCIVWSSSREERDVRVAYRLGANCFFQKPVTTEQLEAVVKQIFEFWIAAERPNLPNC